MSAKKLFSKRTLTKNVLTVCKVCIIGNARCTFSTRPKMVIRRVGAKPDSPISARCAEKHYPVYCTDFRGRHAVAPTDLIINYSCRDVACYIRSIIPIFSFFGRCKQHPYNNIIKKMRDARFTGRGTPRTNRLAEIA